MVNQVPINLKSKKVLVIDDFFNFRLTLKNMLRSFGVLYLDDAFDGEEAMKKMAVRHYHIILCDYNLGNGKSGQQVLEEGRFRGYINYSTIFIMVTAENSLEKIMGAAEYQPDDYLMKPFAREILAKKIKQLIERKENLAEIEAALQKDHYSHAIRLCDDLLAGTPRNLSEIMKIKGELLLKKGAYKDAFDFYNSILTRGNVTWASLGLARVLLMTGQYQEACDAFEIIIGKNDKVMMAYDYLAKTLLKMNHPARAQEVLMRAISISPLSILRQKKLGNIAYRNEDYLTAEHSYRSVVEQGRHSCFKTPSDYTFLAKTLVQRDKPEEGLDILASALQVFPENDEAKLHIELTESYVYKKMHRDTEANKAMHAVQKMLANPEANITDSLQFDLARVYLIMGKKEEALELINRVIEDNHDSNEMMDDVRTVFRENGLADEGEKIIEEIRQKIIFMNNEGVKLAKDGKLPEAMAYFERAASRLPGNKIINANAAQVLMHYMKESGVDHQKLKHVKTYLDRVRKIDEAYIDLPILLSMYNELVSDKEPS